MNDAHRPPWLLLKFVLKLPRPVMQEFRVTRVHGPQEVLPGRRRSEYSTRLVQQRSRCGPDGDPKKSGCHRFQDGSSP